MSRERSIGPASILALVGLLSLAEARAQQLRLTEPVATANHVYQLESQTQPYSSPEQPAATSTATNGPNVEPKVEAAKENHAPAGTLTEAVRPRATALSSALDLPSLSKLTPLDKAYLDVFSILREDNECSRFYSGPRAIEALNQLKLQLKPAYLDRSIALRMQGQTSFTTNHATGLAYRLFDRAELNINGPFYKTSVFPLDSTVHRIGEFSPNTREARVTILLHELGHMIQTSANSFLLPNDGNDPAMSKQNTMRVVEVCREQIKGQSRIPFEQALASVQTGPNTDAADVASTTDAAGSSWSMLETGSPYLLRQFGNKVGARCESCSAEIQIPQDR
jgi:hypothetical protein